MPEDGAAASQPPGALARDASLLSARLPIVGPWIDLFGKLSGTTRRWILFALVVLIVYPIVSFCAVLLLLRVSPAAVQGAARDLILSAIGVSDATAREIDRSNVLVDGEVPMSFGADGRDVYYQNIAKSQDVRFDGLLRMAPTAIQPANCATVSLDPDHPIGTLDVTSTSSSFQGHYRIRAITDALQRIQVIPANEWKALLTDAPASAEGYPFRISFHPDPSLKDDPYFRCYEPRLWVSMTIFKPLMGGQ